MHFSLAQEIVQHFFHIHRSPRAARGCAASIAAGKIDEVSVLRPQRSGAIGMGPRAAMTAAGLDGMSYNDRAQWFESARLDALLGSNKTSLRSFKSGVSCFISFIG